jgi:hypothetical protein
MLVSQRADLFYQLLAATRRRRKITKPLTLRARTPFNQPGNFGRARPFQSSKQLCARAPLSVSKTRIQPSFPLHTTWPGTSFFYLPQQLIQRPPSHQGQRNPHTPPPLLGMVASVCGLWPQCGHLETTQAVTLKSGSSMTLLQFLNLPGWGKTASESSAVSA